MIIFTSICANYLHKARTLAKSVKDNIDGAKFIVCLVEKELPEGYSCEYFDDVVLAKDAWEGNFERFIFKHTIVEASTSVKGQFFKYLYSRFEKEDKFIYLDPDTYVYSDFTELKDILERRPIVLCPHLLQPGNIDMELSSTAHGVYNLGFLAVNASDEAREFINWWAERLYLYCYDDKANGIFTDQKWIDIAPCFFDVEIFKHRGYDFAPWSLLNCGMYEENKKVYVKGDELRFIHFSGFGNTAENCIKKWLPEGEHPFKTLYEGYSIIHNENNKDGISKANWTYNAYDSGEKISDEIRMLYRSNYEVMFLNEDPFKYSNAYFKSKLKFKNKNIFIKIVEYYQKNGLISTIHKAIKYKWRKNK